MAGTVARPSGPSGRWTDARWQKLYADRLPSGPSGLAAGRSGRGVQMNEARNASWQKLDAKQLHRGHQLQMLNQLCHHCIHSLDSLLVALHIFATDKEGPIVILSIHHFVVFIWIKRKWATATVPVWQYFWHRILADNTHPVIKRWPCFDFASSLLASSCLSKSGALLPEIMVPKCLIIWAQNCLFPL